MRGSTSKTRNTSENRKRRNLKELFHTHFSDWLLNCIMRSKMFLLSEILYQMTLLVSSLWQTDIKENEDRILHLTAKTWRQKKY